MKQAILRSLADQGSEIIYILFFRGIDEYGFEQVIPEGLGKKASFAYAHRSEGIPMIGMAKGQYFIAGAVVALAVAGCGLVPPVLDGHFHGHFDRRGAIVGIEYPGKRAGQQGQSSLSAS